MGQKTRKNNIKRDTLLDICIMLCSNRFRNDYSTRIYFSSIHVYSSVLLFPTISNLIDSKLNLSVSSAVRFSMAIVFLAE